MGKPSLAFLVGAGLLAVGAATGCTPRVDTRGNLPNPELVAEIKPGNQSKEEIEEILGSPSHISLFGQETWYYISNRTETTAFFAPELLERQVLVFRFDEQGTVSEVKTLTLENGREVEPIDRETPTAGNKLTIFDQLIGNVGRFGDSKKKK